MSLSTTIEKHILRKYCSNPIGAQAYLMTSPENIATIYQCQNGFSSFLYSEDRFRVTSGENYAFSLRVIINKLN